MHYKNGREAKVGDKVITKDCCGTIHAGVVVALYPGSDTCNIGLVPIGQQFSANAKDSLHMEDALEPKAEVVPIGQVEAMAANPS
jgi:hypothetical protein